MAKQRIGGLNGNGRVDPAVADWMRTAAVNHAALTRKQRKDRRRCRLLLDVPEALKEAAKREADNQDSSVSQVVAFLLAFALAELRGGNRALTDAMYEAKRPARTLQFSWELEIPEEWAHLLGDGTA